MATRKKKKKGRRASRRGHQPVSDATDRDLWVPLDGRLIMEQANSILKQHAPNVPPVPNPGRGLLVVCLNEARRRGLRDAVGDELSLDYREYDNRWIEIERDRSSAIPQDLFSFTITATNSKALRVRFDKGTDINKALRAIWKVFNEPPIVRAKCPLNFSAEKHDILSRVISSLPQPWQRKNLMERLLLELPSDSNANISLSHVKSWIRFMVKEGKLYKTGPDHHPRYQLSPPSPQ